jgi:hypothetical protein
MFTEMLEWKCVAKNGLYVIVPKEVVFFSYLSPIPVLR